MAQAEGWQVLENNIKNKVLEKISPANILTFWSVLTNYFISLGMLKVFKIAEKMITDADKFDSK